MNAWQQWVQRPQNLWVRRALFQVHLWVGIGIGLYVLLVSVSGSAIVYRPQLMNKFARPEPTVAVSGPRLSEADLRQRARQAYSAYEVAEVFASKRADRPTTVVLHRGRTRFARLFNPYTGANLGDPRSPIETAVEWLVDFHDNLLSGETGRLWNGIGSILVTLVALTGAILWWPGIRNWRRSTTVKWQQNFQVFNWRLHSAVGFWCFVFVMLWGLSGIYFIFPQPFNALLGDSRILVWLPRLHFGRFFGRAKNPTWYGPSLAALWAALGLVPVVLVVSGLLMWWNRVLRKRALQSE
jgi:uncharacterized iron-regulated membrane protein